MARRTRLAVALDWTEDEPEDDECACVCSRKSPRPRRNAERAGARSKRVTSACGMARFDAVRSGACGCEVEAEAEAAETNEEAMADEDDDHDAVTDGGPEPGPLVAAAAAIKYALSAPPLSTMRSSRLGLPVAADAA
jgi:hypothetical protein